MNDPAPNPAAANQPLPPLPPPPEPGYHRLEEIADIEPDPDGTIRWWKPGLADAVRQIGWGYATTALALLVLLAACVWLIFCWWGFRMSGVLFELTRLAFVVAMVASIGIGVAVKQIVAKRNDPFCIHCGYSLSGLPDYYTCPECGRPYSFKLIREYRANRDYFILRWHQLRGK